MEVVLDLHLEWVVSQEVMAWDMALLMALHMASPTMVLVLMASLKDMVNNLLSMANSPLPMVNNLRLLTPHRVMAKLSSSNLLVISLLSLLIPSNLHTPNLLTPNLPTHSNLLTPSHLPMVNSLSTLKVVQLDLLGGSALSPVLKAQDCSWIFIVHLQVDINLCTTTSTGINLMP